jgi:protein phosphatase
MLVADGLGTAGAGAVASRIALSTFAHLAIHFGKWNVRVDGSAAAEISERAEMFYRRVHDAVVEGSRANPALSGMATSLTGAYSAGDHLFYVHVGHSRAYLFRDGDLTQFSSDQAVQDRTSETGRLAPVSLQIDELKHILTGCDWRSVQRTARAVEHFRLWDGDIVLLCSDGLTDVVDDDTIADALQAPREPDQQCTDGWWTCAEAGAPDNVTALCWRNAIPKA